MEELNFDSLWQQADKFGEQNVTAPINPISPLAAGKDPKSYSFDQFLNNALNEFEQTVNAPLTQGALKTSPELSDNFRYQDNYRPDFNPLDYGSNTKRYQTLEDWGNVVSKSFDDLGHKFSTSYVEYWQSYARLGKALVTADFSHLDPDPESLTAKYYEDQINERENYIFQTPKEEQDFFNKQFFKDVVGNTGFTLGTFAGVATELAFDMLISAATGGIAAAPSVSATAARFSKVINDFTKGIKYADATVDEIRALKQASTIADTSQLRQIANATSGYNSTIAETMKNYLRAMGIDYRSLKQAEKLHEKFLATLEQIPVAGTMLANTRKLATGWDSLSNASKLGMSFQAFRRSAAEFNLASSEAAFEAVSTYGSTLDQLYRDHLSQKGVQPTADEFLEMKEYAMLASGNNYNTNTAILLLSNKLTFGNVFTRFGPAGRFLNELTQEGSEKVVRVGAKTGLGYMVRKNSYRGLMDASKVIGKKEAFKEMMKTFGISTLGRFSLVEGFQENLQETSNFAWQNYYTRMYSRDPVDMFESVHDGFKEQFTEQGLKTFLLGAFTGVLTQPVIVGAQRGMGQLQELSYRGGMSPYKQARLQQDEAIATMNSYIGSFAEGNYQNLFSDKILNFNVQQKMAEEMNRAAQQGSHYDFNNARENALFTAVKAAIRTNSLDAFTFELQRLGDAFGIQEGITDPAEMKKAVNNSFKQAFGIDLEATKYDSPKALTASIIKDINTYAKVMEEVKASVPKITPFQLEAYPEGSAERWVEGIFYSTVQDAAEIIALNEIKSIESKKRMDDILTELTNTPGMGTVTSYAARVLTNNLMSLSELGMIESELKSLQKTLKDLTGDAAKDIKEQIKDKEKERDLLQAWYALVYKNKEGEIDEKNRATTGLEMMREGRLRPDEDIFDTTDDKGKIKREAKRKQVKDLFKEIIELKNKQSGIETKFRAAVTNSALEKLLDFARLDNDMFDYMNVVDALSNPDNYKQMVYRMFEGKFRAYVINFMDFIENEQFSMKPIVSFLAQLPDSESKSKFLEKAKNIDDIIASEEFQKLQEEVDSSAPMFPKYKEIQDSIKKLYLKYKGEVEENKPEAPVEAPVVEEAPVKKEEKKEPEIKEEVPPQSEQALREVNIDRDFNFAIDGSGDVVYYYEEKKPNGKYTRTSLQFIGGEQFSKGVAKIVFSVLTTDQDGNIQLYPPASSDISDEITVSVMLDLNEYNQSLNPDSRDNLKLMELLENIIKSNKPLRDKLKEALSVGNYTLVEAAEEIDEQEELNKAVSKEKPKQEKPKEPTKEDKPVVPEVKKPAAAEPVSTESPEDILKRRNAANKPQEPIVTETRTPDEIENEVRKILSQIAVSQLDSKLAPDVLRKQRTLLTNALLEAFKEYSKKNNLPLHEKNLTNFLKEPVAMKIISNFKEEGEVETPQPDTSIKKPISSVPDDIKPQAPVTKKEDFNELDDVFGEDKKEEGDDFSELDDAFKC